MTVQRKRGAWVAPVPGFLRRLVSATKAGKIGRALRHDRSAADVWNEQAGTWSIGGVRYWTELRQVHDEINRRVSGHPAVDPYMHLLRTRLPGRLPVARALTIGCGSGELERGLCQHGFAIAHDAFDVAPKAVEKAIAAAREAGLGHLSYRVVDGNALKLEPRAYDVVFGVHAIHHMERLEHVFEEIGRALKPDGLFFMNEFVGPTRFQWTDRQLEAVNGLLRALPEEFRRSTVDGRLKTEVPRPTVAEMIAMDPSEAVRSGEILSVAASYFDIVEVRPYGGTILHLLLHEIAGNFARPGTGGKELLDAISAFEWALVEAGHLESDFAVVVAKAKRA